LVNDGPNSAQAERWAGPAGDHWVEHEADYDRQLEVCGRALIDAASLDGQVQVLDVGCGTGTTTIAAARQARRVVGVDLSPVMIERARTRAAGSANVDFAVADAQTARFDVRFDVIISRFGLMFFADPRAAFANLRRALVSGGRLAAICWQTLDRNDWMRVPGEALARVVPLGDLAEPGQPGPFSLGSRDELLRLLADTGWDDVTVDGLTFPVPVGGARSLDDAVEFVRGSSLGRSALAGVSAAVERRALGAVRDALAPYATGEGVLLGGAAWLVRASNRVTEAPRR
jgi:SAM-dependent methyltransferase